MDVEKWKDAILNLIHSTLFPYHARCDGNHFTMITENRLLRYFSLTRGRYKSHSTDPSTFSRFNDVFYMRYTSNQSAENDRFATIESVRQVALENLPHRPPQLMTICGYVQGGVFRLINELIPWPSAMGCFIERIKMVNKPDVRAISEELQNLCP
jgi:hypothetical protein